MAVVVTEREISEEALAAEEEDREESLEYPPARESFDLEDLHCVLAGVTTIESLVGR
ncbi:hypothetical protein HBI67_065740 [Parastagonospora nodorum]|nr:hypothetical protein HBI67_065740 [Parastagonospora nodorum]KAH6088277.1 hypothetical protein HBI66_031640 [Parastagonospora nodorum]